MTTAETLRALLALVEEAKAGSRELDAELWWAFDGEPLRGIASFRKDASALGVAAALDERFYVFWRRANLVPPPLTTSVDAALALVAKVLPKWSLCLSMAESYRHPNVVMARSYPTNRAVTVEHHTSTLTIIYAMLKALLIEAKEAAHVER